MQEKFDDVIDYINELWFKYLSSCEFRIANAQITDHEKRDVSESLDLIRAINSYRAYPTAKLLYESYPELKKQDAYVQALWKHFDSLDYLQLAELAILMIHEIDNFVPSLDTL